MTSLYSFRLFIYTLNFLTTTAQLELPGLLAISQASTHPSVGKIRILTYFSSLGERVNVSTHTFRKANRYQYTITHTY